MCIVAVCVECVFSITTALVRQALVIFHKIKAMFDVFDAHCTDVNSTLRYDLSSII